MTRWVKKNAMAWFVVASLLAAGDQLYAQGTVFTYQGRLNAGASPANGGFDLTFALFSVSSGPGQVGGSLTNAATAVSNGRFTVMLDFGNQFPGADRWLEIGVRTNGGGDFTPLSPRQKLTATPYAVTAASLSGPLASAQLTGTYSGAVTFNNAGNNFAGNGAGLTNLNASTLALGTVPDGRLSENIAFRNAANTFTSNQVIQGSLGIRATPLADLHIRGQGTNGMVLVTPNTSDSRSQIMLSENTGGTLGMILRYDGDVSSNPLHVVGRYSSGSETELVTIERNGGNVGIGTNNPAYKLHVAGSLHVTAGGTALTINPDGSIVIQSAKTVSITSAGDIDLLSEQNLSITSSNLNISVQRDLAIKVGERIGITNNSQATWKNYANIRLESDAFNLTTSDDTVINAANINLNASSNINAKAVGDVLIKGAKILQN